MDYKNIPFVKASELRTEYNGFTPYVIHWFAEQLKTVSMKGQTYLCIPMPQDIINLITAKFMNVLTTEEAEKIISNLKKVLLVNGYYINGTQNTVSWS